MLECHQLVTGASAYRNLAQVEPDSQLSSQEHF